MKTVLLCVCLFFALAWATKEASSNGDAIESLAVLKKAFDLELITSQEYEASKWQILNQLGAKPTVQASSGGSIFSPQLKFLLNQLRDGLPRSYDDVLPNGDNYWVTPVYLDVGAIDPFGNKVDLDSEIAIQERTLTHYGLNLYDGATWTIALALEELGAVATLYERNVLYPSSTGADDKVGGIVNIRSDSTDYKYGVSGISGDMLSQITLPGNVTRVIAIDGTPTTSTTKRQPGAFFYRMIGPKYTMTDPLVGDYGIEWKFPWPNNDTTTPWNIAGVIHWNDWKPITGENVWGAIMGPIQVMWINAKGNISNFQTFAEAPSAIQLAISILPALKALKSPLGSLYHCPSGTQMFPPDPNEESNVSNENNFSAYASLRMLAEVLVKFTQGTTDNVLLRAITDVKDLMTGLEGWFSKYLLSDPFKGYSVIYQGGHVKFDGVFEAAPLAEVGGFAVDCQTWGLSVLGQAKVDSWYGVGTAYNLWQATKKFAGYFDPQGRLGGVGYTIVDGNKTNLIWSAEWTWGAIGACEKISNEYRKAGKTAWADDLAADAKSMLSLVSQPLVRCKNGGWCGGGLVQEDGSYLYANDRFFIPWGWYANPIGSTCSTAWAVMHQHNYNPFILGGGDVSPIPL